MARNPRYLTDVEVYKILDNIVARHSIDISVTLGLFLGMRVSEIWQTRRSDIKHSLHTGLYTIRRDIAKYGHQRTIPVCDILGKKLQTWYRAHDTHNVKHLVLWNCSLRTVQRRFHDFFHSLNIFCTPHDLRHTFAAALYNQCKDLSLVQTAMGHTNLSSTLIYAHVDGILQNEINKAYESYTTPPKRKTYDVKFKRKP